MKKIWLLGLCLASLSLVGCFHVPDEDWIPSRNKVNTWSTQEDEVEKALNSFMEWIDIVSSQWNELNNQKSGNIINENSDETLVEIENNGITDNESVDWETGDILDEWLTQL